MTLTTVKYVLDRVFKDPALLHGYLTDPEHTLASFDLAPEEIEAIRSGDRERLIEVGMDERVAGWVIRSTPREVPE